MRYEICKMFSTTLWQISYHWSKSWIKTSNNWVKNTWTYNLEYRVPINVMSLPIIGNCSTILYQCIAKKLISTTKEWNSNSKSLMFWILSFQFGRKYQYQVKFCFLWSKSAKYLPEFGSFIFLLTVSLKIKTK